MKSLLTEKNLMLVIVFMFFLAYSILGVIKHNHFLSGYDLAIVDQAIWKYSQFKQAITTNHAFPFIPLLQDHVELIYILVSPLYWIINDARALIVLQSFLITTSSIPIYLLCKDKKIKTIVCFSILISFLSFYGVQHAIWSDVHSLVFGVSFLPWFILFCERKKWRIAFIFFVLSIISKEDMAFITFLISASLFLSKIDFKNFNKNTFLKNPLILFMILSIAYLLIIFFIYFPYFVEFGYKYQSPNGIVSDINLENFYNTKDKRDVIFYSLSHFGFIPLLSPIFMIPSFSDIFKYFVIANSVVTSSHSIFMHYRVSLAVLLVLPLIYTLSKFKNLNNVYTAVYLLLCAAILQYHLHLPLSYLAKKWFWTKPPSATGIELALAKLPKDSRVATQVNIAPHVSHRDFAFILWYEAHDFKKNSPCGKKICEWFKWPDNPEYLIIDTSTDWDERYWLINRENFIRGIQNLEKAGVIKVKYTFDTTQFFEVLKNPTVYAESN